MLRDLLKHLPEDHPDFASLTESLDQFGEKATMLNVKKKEAEVFITLSLLCTSHLFEREREREIKREREREVKD